MISVDIRASIAWIKTRFDIKKQPLNSNIDIHILSISSTIHTHPHTWKKAPGEYGACGSVHGFHLDDGVSNWCVIISDEKSTGEYYHHHHNDSNGGGGWSRSFLMCGFFPHSFCSLVLLFLAMSRARRLALYELMIQIRFVKLSAPDLFRLNFAPFPLIFESNCQIGNISFLFCSQKVRWQKSVVLLELMVSPHKIAIDFPLIPISNARFLSLS